MNGSTACNLEFGKSRISVGSLRRRPVRARRTLGDLPEWDLADLYSGMEAPELKRDIAKAIADADRFESRWKGTLAAEAERADSTAGWARRLPPMRRWRN